MDHPNESSENNGFISGDNFETDKDVFYEDYIIADRAGLEVLRDKISEVLETGEPTTFSDTAIDSDFGGVTLGKKNPSKPSESGWVETVGCLFLVAIAIFLLLALLLGLQQIWNLVLGLINGSK